MLVRRRFRVKAMQFLYMKYISSNIDDKIIESIMLQSIDKIYDLYICLMNLLLSLKKLEEKKIKINSLDKRRLYNNTFLEILSKNIEIIKYSKENKELTWENKDGYINFLLEKLKNWSQYKIYISQKNISFDNDKKFILKYYKTHIKYNEKISESLEDIYITSTDDLDIVHDIVFKILKIIGNNNYSSSFSLYNIYKEKYYKNFIINLYRKTLLHNKFFDKMISDTVKNWDLSRIAILDRIILQMSLCEFLYFPTIPPKVTMNEYIEITKVYSTQKSRIFINGMLNKILNILNEKKKIFKIGKGLL